jgi:hypothetical protein
MQGAHFDDSWLLWKQCVKGCAAGTDRCCSASCCEIALASSSSLCRSASSCALNASSICTSKQRAPQSQMRHSARRATVC